MVHGAEEKQQPLFRRLRDARRHRGMTQSDLAKAVGCRQSAISMLENGRPDALSLEGITQIATLLEVDPGAGDPLLPASPAAGRPYCPAPECPSNFPSEIAGEVRLWPFANTGTGRHCRFCGEVLERSCPNPDCRAPAKAGACCERCGTPLIAVSPDAGHNSPGEWIAHRRREIATLFERLESLAE